MLFIKHNKLTLFANLARVSIPIDSRLTLRYVYVKQWKVSRVPYDELVVAEADYPVPPGWQRVFWQECPVQTRFFEALLRLPGRSGT